MGWEPIFHISNLTGHPNSFVLFIYTSPDGSIFSFDVVLGRHSSSLGLSEPNQIFLFSQNVHDLPRMEDENKRERFIGILLHTDNNYRSTYYLFNSGNI